MYHSTLGAFYAGGDLLVRTCVEWQIIRGGDDLL